jgi:hypothetical protein
MIAFKILLAILVLSISNSILAGENASNPLAAVSNTDIRLKTFDLENGDRQEAFIDGATMLNPKLKLKYELHWWDTDVTGQDENDWERALLKLIYFPKEGKLKNGNPYRLAIGLDWSVDLGDPAKGIGSGSDQVGPFVGVATPVKPGLLFIPLLQHFVDYSGIDVSVTAARLIALQTLSEGKWFKMDLKVPYDWENETWPADVELQLGKSFTPKIGAYFDAQAGIGNDRPYDWAVGVGFRFNY